MSYSVRNCARNLLRSLSSHPHQYVPHLQQPCWAHVGPMWGPVSAALPRGCTWQLCFKIKLPRACWTPDLLTRPRQVSPPSQGVQATFKPTPNLFSCGPSKAWAPFPVVESLSSPPCLGGTTLLYILHPFYTVLLEIKLSAPTSKCCLWYIRKLHRGKQTKQNLISLSQLRFFKNYYFTMGFLFLINFYLSTEHFFKTLNNGFFVTTHIYPSPKQSLPINNTSTLH